MVTTCNLYEAKTQLSKLVERAAAGEEIVIAKAGKPMAKLVPLGRRPLRSGLLKGKIWMAEDFDDTSEEIIRAFEDSEIFLAADEDDRMATTSCSTRMPQSGGWRAAPGWQLPAIVLCDDADLPMSAWPAPGGRDQDFLGRLRLTAPFGATVEASGFAFLPLTLTHVEEVAALPLHHRDPFDRMLVAQARVEILTLISGDRRLAAYDVPRFWA